MEWKEVESHPKLSKLEDNVRKFWEKERIFERSVEERPKDSPFSFYDGPPYATGLPHYGHILQSYMKDAIPRFWTMKGKRVERRWGWDCHGLPIENIVEKELGIKTKKQIEELGVVKFCELCEGQVMRCAKDWKKYIEKVGRWVDMENDYKTMDPEFMESDWWAFKELWKKKLIAKGRKSIWACPRCATPLAQIEVNDQSVYQEIEDPSIVVKFKVSDQENTYLLAWTTTPWTIPANVLLAVDPNEKYVKVEANGKHYYLADKRKDEVFKLAEIKNFNVEEEMKGKDLVGTKYEPVFKGMKAEAGKIYEVIEGDFVTMDEGTGIVHTAPAYGQDDFDLGEKLKAGFIQHLTLDGIFKEPKDVKGMFIWNKKSEEKLLELMKKMDTLLYNGRATHAYPECWRCHTKLFTYGMTAWFMEVTKIKSNLLKALDRTYWIPEHAKTGRLGDWLKNLQDWCISRNRYWGTPLPVWECNNCNHTEVIGSIKELEEKTGKEVNNLHRHHVDQLTWKCTKCEGEMHRIEEVLDCWFDAGSMPYGFSHYPFENKEWFERNFPADFVGEGIEQATKWFYSLLAISVGIFNKPPYENVVSTGIILAEDGKKMSKSLRNYPDPLKLFEETSSDAIRFFLFNSPVVKGEFMRFSEKGVRDVVKNLLMLYWNTYKFFVTYAKLHNWKPKFHVKANSSNVMDKWIVAKTDKLLRQINKAFEKYDLAAVVKPIQPFIFDLSTWYVRRSRSRFAKGDADALETLYYVLYNFSLATAPVLPFTTEAVWQGLVRPWKKNSDSVHLELMPKVKKTSKESAKIEEQMKTIRSLVSEVHKLRDKSGFNLRQPLSELEVSGVELESWMEKIIKDELNVKELNVVKAVSTGKNWKESEYQKVKVALNTELTPELKEEGLIRELIRMVQDARKKQGYQVGEKADVKIELPKGVTQKIVKVVEKETNSSMRNT